jgi:hypothetical protein
MYQYYNIFLSFHLLWLHFLEKLQNSLKYLFHFSLTTLVRCPLRVDEYLTIFARDMQRNAVGINVQCS